MSEYTYGYGFEVRRSAWGTYARTVIYGSTVAVESGFFHHSDSCGAIVNTLSRVYEEREFNTTEEAASYAFSVVDSKISEGHEPFGNLIVFPNTSGWAMLDYYNHPNRIVPNRGWGDHLEGTCNFIGAHTDEDTAFHLLRILSLGDFDIPFDVMSSLSEHPSAAVQQIANHRLMSAALF